MDKDTFINSIKEIGSCEDSVERLSKLTDLQNEVSKIFDDKTGLETEVQTLKDSITDKDKEIQKARDYAMDMFLQVGKEKSDNQVKSEQTGIKEEPKKEYKSYKELAKNYVK